MMSLTLCAGLLVCDGVTFSRTPGGVPPLFVNTFSAELMLRRKGGARCDGKQGVSSTSVPDVREHVRANTHPPCVSWVRVHEPA
jgi:hypothetical protein